MSLRPKLWVYLVAILFFLVTSCSPQPKIITIENEGKVCIQQRNYKFSATITSERCLSGSIHCTEIREQSGEIKVDREHFKIQIFSKFVIANSAGLHACDADCSGVGSTILGSIALPEGTYTVQFGEMTMGEITIPVENQTDPICFTTKHPIPKATYSGPTATVYPYESPLAAPNP